MAVFLDTNILIYSISDAPAEISKRDRSIALLARRDCILSVQVLQEFYVQATRASRPAPLSHEKAVAFITAWRRFPVQPMTLALLQDALAIRAAHRFSYWDCAVIAAAKAGRCEDLFTEDMSDGQVIDGVRISNPFM